MMSRSAQALLSVASATNPDDSLHRSLSYRASFFNPLDLDKIPTIYQQYQAVLSSSEPLHLSTQYQCRGSARETILLDTTSAILIDCFEQLWGSLQTEEAATQTDDIGDVPIVPVIHAGNYLEFFHQIMQFVRQLFSAQNRISESDIEAVIMHHQQDVGIPVTPKKLAYVPIDIFIAAEMGYCRHQAILLAFLMAKWSERVHGATEDRVYWCHFQLVSESKSLSSHALVILQKPNRETYLIDSSYRIAIRIDSVSDSDRALLSASYSGFNIQQLIDDIQSKYCKLAVSPRLT
jgi:hypothetical protein